MRHLLPKFSVSMPGAKVDWPFEKNAEDHQCPHLATQTAKGTRRFFVKGLWLCEPCHSNVGKLIADLLS